MKRVLFCGGNYADVPLIQSLKSLGHHVISSGNRPDDVGHLFSDEYVFGDFSKPEEMLQIAKELCIDGVVPGCNDFAAVSASLVAGELSLPGHDPIETTLLIHQKDKYRLFAESCDIPSPKTYRFKRPQVKDIIGLGISTPCIVKPVDLTGGKGISLVEVRSDFQRSIDLALSMSRTDRIVVEEFVQGSHHGCSCLIADGEIKFMFIDDEHYYVNKFMVSGASYPGRVACNVENSLKVIVDKIVNSLKLRDGILHLQFIIDNDRPVIIEVCRRPPGDLYVNLVKHATGLDYPLRIVRAFLGEKDDDPHVQEAESFVLRHCMMAKNNGRLTRIGFNHELIGNIVEQHLFMKSGEFVKDFMTQKIGIIIFKFSSRNDYEKKSGLVKSPTHVEVQ